MTNRVWILRGATLLALLAFLGCSTLKTNDPPSKWTALNAGMTREELAEMLGPPSVHLGPSRDLWQSKGWELQVDYDQNGRAREIMRNQLGK